MEGWREQLRKPVVPILRRPLKRGARKPPEITNMVTTLSFLHEKDGQLPLAAISHSNGMASQFAPRLFAANIAKISYLQCNSTALVFSSGRCVVTTGRTEMHSIFVAQMYRLAIENTSCMTYDRATGALAYGSLKGRTAFVDYDVRNIVGYGHIGSGLDLERFRSAHPDTVKYMADTFPAAKVNMWLTPDQKCHCSFSKKKSAANKAEEAEIIARVGRTSGKKRCSCTVKCLCYHTGNITMVGGRCVEDINKAFHLVCTVLIACKATETRTAPVGRVVSPDEEADFPPRKKRAVIPSDDLMPFILSEMRNYKTKTPRSGLLRHQNLTPLMRFCEAGRLDEVRTTLLHEPGQLTDVHDGQTVLEWLGAMERTPEQEAVYQFLKNTKE